MTERFRLGRNWIAVGDRVKICSTPGHRDGFTTRVRLIRCDDTGPHSVDVADERGGIRTVPISRVKRLAQTKGGVKL